MAKHALYSFKVWSLTGVFGSLCLPAVFVLQSNNTTSHLFGEAIMGYAFALFGSMIVFSIAGVLFSIVSFHVSKFLVEEEQKKLIVMMIGMCLVLTYYVVPIIVSSNDESLFDKLILVVVASYLFANIISIKILNYPSNNS